MQVNPTGTPALTLQAENSIFAIEPQSGGTVLELFKKNHLFNSLLLLPYALVIRSVVILFPDARIPGEANGSWATDFVLATHQWGGGEFLFSTLLVFIQAVMINRLFIKQNMLGDINLFPGLCYILLTALHPSFIGISSLLLAITTFLIALAYLFDVLKKEDQEATRFMIGWWLAVSGLLYSPFFMLLFFGLISMSMLKTLKMKDIFQFVTGYISPFLIGWMIRVIVTHEFQPVMLNMFASWGIPGLPSSFDISDILAISVFGMLLLICILGYTQIIARKNIHAQKKIDTMYALVFFSIPMAFFLTELSVRYFMVIAVPLSLFLAILLKNIKHPAISESLHFILFITALVTQFMLLI